MLPPGPPSALWVTLRYLRDPYLVILEGPKKYGDPFTFPTLQGPIVVTGDPAGVHALLSADPDGYAAFGEKNLKPFLGENSLFLLAGHAHKAARKLLAPPLHGARMRTYGRLMREAAIKQAETWSLDRTFSLHEATQAISLDIIVHAVFGLSDSPHNAAWRRLIVDAMHAAGPALALFPFLRHEFGGLGPWARVQRLRRELQALVSREIAARRADPREREDIFSLLIEARFDDGTGLDDQALLEQLLTLVIAGHETTGIALAWANYWLHRDPESLERLRAEVDALGPEPEPDALARLPFLDAVCHETLRLYPITPLVTRQLTRPFTLLDHDLPAGVGVAAGVCLLHAREDLYPEPARFRPERFRERTYSPSEYLPFGGGHRRCIGAAFALYSMKIVLATLISHYRLRLANERPVIPEARLFTVGPKGGVEMVLCERRAAH